MRYWLIGIAGVAMGGLAIALGEQGHEVNGSDEGVYPPMSEMLAQAGVTFQNGFDAKGLQHWARGGGVVIVGNAIPRGNVELEAALNAGLRLSSLPEILHEEFLEGCHRLVVSGTHGKTTTSNLLAYIFQELNLEPGWMVGGRTFGLPSSLQAAGPRLTDPLSRKQSPSPPAYRPTQQDRPPFILEGDEYDTIFYDKRSKFFHYWPNTLIINHIEFDHADIFKGIEEIKTAFRRLVNMVPETGCVIYNGDSEFVREVVQDAFCPLISFGKGPTNLYRVIDEEATENGSTYTVRIPSQPTELSRAHAMHPEGTYRLKSPLQGAYNGRNILAALAACDAHGLDREQIFPIIERFEGPARRMDRYDLDENLVLFDDFAHHPTAVRESLESLRKRFPSHRITCIVEPRSNTSVRNILQPDWEKALSNADAVIMGALHRPWKYAAEELFNFEHAKAHLENSGTTFAQFNEVQDILARLFSDLEKESKENLWVIFSNGNFQGLREKLIAHAKG
jgi:UDP-N-acetylmuramate: L-alanyl-gamma-D-glutamyl-meso-diaminopimelate ligase